MKLTAAILTFLLTLNFTFADDGLHVGTAAVDISPTVFPIQLRSGSSNYVHDPMHVRAIAFQNGEGRVVVALVDAIGTGREMSDEAKRLLPSEPAGTLRKCWSWHPRPHHSQGRRYLPRSNRLREDVSIPR